MNRKIQQRNKGNNEITKRTKNSRQKNKTKRFHTKQRKNMKQKPILFDRSKNCKKQKRRS